MLIDMAKLKVQNKIVESTVYTLRKDTSKYKDKNQSSNGRLAVPQLPQK